MDHQFSFTKNKTEWINSQLIFEIINEGDQNKMKFTHKGLTPKNECHEICDDPWNNYIKNSLHKLISTGKGEPNLEE